LAAAPRTEHLFESPMQARNNSQSLATSRRTLAGRGLLAAVLPVLCLMAAAPAALAQGAMRDAAVPVANVQAQGPAYRAAPGVAPDQVETTYTGSHDAVYKAVLEGKAAAGGGVPRSFNALPAEQREKLVVLAKTEEVAPQPFAVHPRLYRSVVAKIQRAMIKLNWAPEGKDILQSIQYKEIVVSNDFDYDVHREVAQRLKIPF